MARTNLKLKLNGDGRETSFNIYDNKSDAIINDTSSGDKKCLVVKKSDSIGYVATNNRSDYPSTSPLTLKEGASTRYIHQNTIIKKVVYYNPDIVNPNNQPYSSNPELYEDNPFEYTHHYSERIATEIKETWHGWWCTNSLGFNGVLPVNIYDPTPFWTPDEHTINVHASNWFAWHAQNGIYIYAWYEVSEQRGTGIYDYKDEPRSKPMTSAATEVEVVY